MAARAAAKQVITDVVIETGLERFDVNSSCLTMAQSHWPKCNWSMSRFDRLYVCDYNIDNGL